MNDSDESVYAVTDDIYGGPDDIVEPPNVFAASSIGNEWIVEAPPGRMTSSGLQRRFTGPNAQYCALAYAYEAFGNARFFFH